MKRNLSAFAVWGLSFGYAVGWGAFVMPGAAFLPGAGPLGTLVGVVIGAAVMAVIGWNYHKMSSASVAMYSMLAMLPVLSHPEEYATWTEYLGARVGLSGLDSMPTFAAARVALGVGGVALVGAAMFAGIFTGIVAATVAMSRLLYSLAASDVLPRTGWLGRLDSNGSPRNAILFTVGISLVIPFFGRTVIGWPVDVSSIGAAVAYCVTSAAAFKFACRNGDVVTKATGLVGAVNAIVAFQERHCALHHGASDVKALHNEQGFVTDEMEMKDSYTQSGFDGILIKPANLESLRRLFQ